MYLHWLRGGAIKRQPRATYSCIMAQAKVRDRGLGLRPRQYAVSVCSDRDVEAAYTAIVALYINEPLNLVLPVHGVICVRCCSKSAKVKIWKSGVTLPPPVSIVVTVLMIPYSGNDRPLSITKVGHGLDYAWMGLHWIGSAKLNPCPIQSITLSI